MSVRGYYFISWLFLTEFAKGWIKSHLCEAAAGQVGGKSLSPEPQPNIRHGRTLLRTVVPVPVTCHCFHLAAVLQPIALPAQLLHTIHFIYWERRKGTRNLLKSIVRQFFLLTSLGPRSKI